MGYHFSEFKITADPNKMDLVSIHDFLSTHSDWSRNIPLEKVKKAFPHFKPADDFVNQVKEGNLQQV